jgi:cytoskeletal protein CcmA (bactofilin family)
MFAKRDKRGDEIGRSVRPATTPATAPATGVTPAGSVVAPSIPGSATLSPPAVSVPSIVAASMTMTGDVISDGEVHVDGTVVGGVVCHDLTVGQGGRVTGLVRAARVRVHGTVDGDIVGEHLEVTATGRVVGRVFLRTLQVEAGAAYYCETRPYEEASAEPSRATQTVADASATPPAAVHAPFLHPPSQED